ncbi:MAG: hypothetical protein U0L26_02860 [Cellulosilyticum sp.]|nr:hypothetical protein [Cellulosilyticum sp.]MEE1071322.1 hypothetical protein [Cellulosilyticum sp.]
MAIKRNLVYILIILLSFLMMPLKSFGMSKTQTNHIIVGMKEKVCLRQDMPFFTL